MSDSESEVELCPKRRKGVRNTSEYPREKQKTARARGQEYTTAKGAVIPAKRTGPACSCPKQCFEKVTEEDQMCLISSLYDGKSKNEHDLYLMGLIECAPIARRRSNKEEPSFLKKGSYKFFILNGSERVQVCRKAFSSFYAVGDKAIVRLTSLLVSGQSPNDGRGKQMNRGNALGADVIAKIDGHIRSFPTHVSHYSNRNIIYLDTQLNVKIMHDLFCEKYTDLNVKYEFYLKYFRENFNYPFGRPQVDVCSACEELGAKLKSPFLNDTAKRVAAAELIVHKRRASKFYKKLQEVTNLCQERNDVIGIVFDFMQNLPLPCIPVQEMFYLRKLWLYVFGIHNLKDGTAKFYCYHEGQAKRGPDEVCSFLYDYIKNLPETVKELHFFSDSCGGQNRNHTVVRFLLYLAMTERFTIIHQYFPLRGHSFLPCDRDFGVIKRVVRKHDRIYSVIEYIQMIVNARSKINDFQVNIIESVDIIDFKNWWPNFFKKNALSLTKDKLSLAMYKYLVYRSNTPGYVVVSDFIDGLVCKTFRLTKGNGKPMCPIDKAYKSPIPLNAKKLQDVAKIIKYIPVEHKEFYHSIIQWPQVKSDQSEIESD